MLRFSGNHISSMETKSSKFQNDTLINIRFMLVLEKVAKSGKSALSFKLHFNQRNTNTMIEDHHTKHTETVTDMK